MYVLDASVVLKWYLQENDSGLALNLRQKFISGTCALALPDLILYEAANVLRYEKVFSHHAAYEAVEALIDLGIDLIVPTKSMIGYAMELAYKRNITFYDSTYLSLAAELKYTFVTADAKLFNKVNDLKFVKLLSEV